jgi:nitric oxide reductase NorE protein
MSAEISATATERRRWRPLTGGVAIWIFMTVEVVTFSMFLLHYALSWRGDVAVYAASQARLHPGSATFGTLLLLLGSWAAYQGVLAHEARWSRAAALWFLGTTFSGVAFAANKIHEYASLHGVNLSTNGFWFSYLFLTALHLLHVLIGVGAFGWLAVKSWRATRGEPGDSRIFQTGAAYWHLVDVIWLLLFPMLYLMHP